MQEIALRIAQAKDIDGIRSLVAAVAHERGGTTNAEAVANVVDECVSQSDHDIVLATAGQTSGPKRHTIVVSSRGERA